MGIGRRTTKVTPLSGFGWEKTSPPSASTIFFTIARPSPVPPLFVEKKGEKTISCSSSFIP